MVENNDENTFLEDEDDYNLWRIKVFEFIQRELYYLSEQDFKKAREFFYYNIPVFTPLYDRIFIMTCIVDNANPQTSYFKHLHNFFDLCMRLTIRRDIMKTYEQSKQPVLLPSGYQGLINYNTLFNSILSSYYKMIRRDRTPEEIFQYLQYATQMFQGLLDEEWYKKQDEIQKKNIYTEHKCQTLLHEFILLCDRRGQVNKQDVVLVYPKSKNTPKKREEVLYNV